MEMCSPPRRRHRDRKIVFAAGFLIGASLGIFAGFLRRETPLASLEYGQVEYDFRYEEWLAAKFGAMKRPVDPDVMRYNKSDDAGAGDIRPEADFLFDKVHLSCLVLMPTRVDKAKAIRATWGQHCNWLGFSSNKKHNGSDGIDYTEAKSEFHLLCSSLSRLWHEKKDAMMWVLVVNEDTYAIPENLRFFVAPMNHSEPHYLGHAMRFWNVAYNWGEAGYALSKGAVSLLVDKFAGGSACSGGGRHWKNSDWYLAKHLADRGVGPADTRDHAGRSRFVGHSLQRLLFPGAVSPFERYWRDSLFASPDGPHCCSNFALTFRLAASATKTHQLAYFVYNLRPFYAGGVHGNRLAPDSNEARPDPAFSLDERLKAEAWEKLLLGHNTSLPRP